MRTTLNLDGELFERASRALGISEKTKLIHLGLQALIRQAAAERLARLYGRVKKAKVVSRRRRLWS